MSTITVREIESLYKKCGLESQDNQVIRNTLNKGSLDNKLNTSYVSAYKNDVNQYTNNVTALR